MKMNMRKPNKGNIEWKELYTVSCINTVCYPSIFPETTAVYENWEDLWDTEELDKHSDSGASRDKPLSCREFRGTYVKLYIDRGYMPYSKKEGEHGNEEN